MAVLVHSERQPMTFGKWLGRQIEERLMSQPQFARASGIPLATLKAWMVRGTTRLPRGPHVVRLARALGLPRHRVERAIRRGHGVAASTE